MTVSCRWYLDGGPNSGSRQIRPAGNTNCHIHCDAAFGNLRSNARQDDAAKSSSEVRAMLRTYGIEMLPQPIAHTVGHHDAPVLLALAPSNRNLPSLEIDIFDAELEALLQSQPTSIKQRRHDPRHAAHLLQYASHFRRCQPCAGCSDARGWLREPGREVSEGAPYQTSARIADSLDLGVERDEKFGNVAKVTTKALSDDIHVTPGGDAVHSNFLEERRFRLPE